MILCDRPSSLFLLLLLTPAALYVFVRFRRLTVALGGLYSNTDAHNAVALRRLRRSFILKMLLRGFCWIFFVLSFAGISWGKKTVPVQKNGNAVCLVFDISYSMNAKDAGGGLTRLQAARQYAEYLLNAIPQPSVSVVLAKGDGVLALPLTEDRSAMQSLLDALSPELMTTAGSSIGRGIAAALNSFPHNSAQAAHVWVFTDGDETDNALQPALDDAVRFCIPVTLIGFGSESGAQVLAGDGMTNVHTALNADALQIACARANEKNLLPARKKLPDVVRYVEARANGSAYALLHSLSENENSDSSAYAYEVQPIDRHEIFLLIAILCFIASFIVGEADILSLRHATAVMFVLIPVLFTSCDVSGSSHILKGTWAWYQKKFQQATAIFFQTHSNALSEQNVTLQQYALFGLSATYLSQEEYQAALSRLEQIAPDAPAPLKSAALYNQGIIAHHNGDNEKAIAFFKEAILADGTNLNAKINLEFCQTEESMRQAQGAEKEMQRAGEGKDESKLEQGIFTLIKENEQNQWKKIQASLDY